MTIEERLANLEKGYKQLCQSHDRNKHVNLALSNLIQQVSDNFKEMQSIVKDQQKVQLQIVKTLQEIQENK